MIRFLHRSLRLIHHILILSLGLPLFPAAPGNVIFIHPDGTGLGHWTAGRLYHAGPDGRLNWDRLDHMAAYTPHQRGWLSTTSHAGATAHAYGVKADPDEFGMREGQPLTAANGLRETMMETAMRSGLRVGVINTGHIGEPGTAVFLARSQRRDDVALIAEQVLHSGADVIFSGGEVYLIPEGTMGHHGQPGRRLDGRHLLEEAREAGYTVIFDRESLFALPDNSEKVLGIFAATNTYNAYTEGYLQRRDLPPYDSDAPTFAEMLQVALRILGNDPEKRFFLVAEEEGTDNFSNKTNAAGMLEALRRADEGIGEALAFLDARETEDTLLLVAADSDAGHPTVWAPRELAAGETLPATTSRGAALDGQSGGGGLPFITPPDRYGQSHAFGIAWPISDDMPGSAVIKATGLGASALGSLVDNTEVYPLIHRVLIGDLTAASYRNWTQWTLPGHSESNRNPDSDPDGDGKSNLVEFLIRTDPAEHDDIPAVVPLVEGGTGNRRFLLPQLRESSTEARLQFSADMTAWENAEIVRSGAGWSSDHRNLRVISSRLLAHGWQLGISLEYDAPATFLRLNGAMARD